MVQGLLVMLLHPAERPLALHIFEPEEGVGLLGLERRDGTDGGDERPGERECKQTCHFMCSFLLAFQIRRRDAAKT